MVGVHLSENKEEHEGTEKNLKKPIKIVMILFSFLIGLKQDYFDIFSSFKFFSVIFSSSFSSQKWQFWCLAFFLLSGLSSHSERQHGQL